MKIAGHKLTIRQTVSTSSVFDISCTAQVTFGVKDTFNKNYAHAEREKAITHRMEASLEDYFYLDPKEALIALKDEYFRDAALTKKIDEVLKMLTVEITGDD